MLKGLLQKWPQNLNVNGNFHFLAISLLQNSKIRFLKVKSWSFSKTLLSTGNERELELKYLKILFHISNWNFQCWNSKFLKPTLGRTGKWVVAVHGGRSVASAPCHMWPWWWNIKCLAKRKKVKICDQDWNLNVLDWEG